MNRATLHRQLLLDRADRVRHRATIHLVTAADHGRFEPLLRPFPHRRFASSPFGSVLDGLDVREFTEAVAALLEEQPRTRREISDLLGARWPDRDATALGHAGSYLVPSVQVPPRAVWRRSGAARWTTATRWLGPTGPAAPVEEFVRR